MGGWSCHDVGGWFFACRKIRKKQHKAFLYYIYIICTHSLRRKKVEYLVHRDNLLTYVSKDFFKLVLKGVWIVQGVPYGYSGVVCFFKRSFNKVLIEVAYTLAKKTTKWLFSCLE